MRTALSSGIPTPTMTSVHFSQSDEARLSNFYVSGVTLGPTLRICFYPPFAAGINNILSRLLGNCLFICGVKTRKKMRILSDV
jgi:hypothetical protein